MSLHSVPAMRHLGKNKSLVLYSMMVSSDFGGSDVTLFDGMVMRATDRLNLLLELMDKAGIQRAEVEIRSDNPLIINWRGEKMDEQRRTTILANLRRA